jgi:hypothetical protein
MRLVEELASAGFKLTTATPKIHCKVFEDNSGALEMARTPKMRPRTKHMNLKYHHFREAVQQGKVTIHAINTLDQMADIFTKPLERTLFQKLRYSIMGWSSCFVFVNHNFIRGSEAITKYGYANNETK